MANGIPQPGDTLVIEKSAGRSDVRKLKDGVWEPVRDDAGNEDAWAIARARLEPSGHTIWFRRESEPDSAIRLYPRH